MAQIQAVANEPALLIIESRTKKRILVVGDLHIGIEVGLGTERIAKKAIEDMIAHIEEIAKETKADLLVLVGDIRHALPSEKEYWQQLDEDEEVAHRVSIEIPDMLFRLKKVCEVRIIPGNHDGGLKSYFETSDEIVIENVGIVHSHKWPKEEMMGRIDTLVVAHSHPAVAFRDEFGYRTREKAWVKGEVDSKELKIQYPNINTGAIKVIVMPAFNPLVVGTPINERSERKFLGPLLKDKLFKLNKTEIFLLDGTSIAIDYTAKESRKKGEKYGKRKDNSGKMQRLRKKRSKS